MRRHKYFYIPIEGTPFSLGLALPEGYGMYEFLAEQEIKHAKFNGEIDKPSRLSIIYKEVYRYTFPLFERKKKKKKK